MTVLAPIAVPRLAVKDPTMFNRQARVVLSVLGSRKGAAMVEYALLIALLSLVASVALTALGTNIRTMFAALATKI